MTKLLSQQTTGTSANRQAGSSLPSLSHCLSFCAPRISVVWLYAPIAILQGIYAKYYDVSLTAIASVILLARFFDAITDPLVGYWSDRYCRQRGTRKPFILLGGVLLIVSSYFLYVPVNIDLANIGQVGSIPSATVSVAYLTVWYLGFYLAFTLFDIPHYAWASELATSSAGKSKIYSIQGVAGYIGLAIFYTIPLLPFFESTEITPYTLKISVVTAGILMLLFLAICVMRTPNRSTGGTLSYPVSNGVASNNMLASILSNKPLLLFLSFFIFQSACYGLWYGLVFLYIDSYLNLGEYFAKIFFIAFLVGIAVIPLWYKASVILGRTTTLALGLVMLIVSFACTGMLVPEKTSFEQLLWLNIINTMGIACITALTPAMLSEIIDYGDWQFGGQHAGIYFSTYSFSAKASIALGTALGLAIVGWAGYDATASSQSAGAVKNLMLGMVWLPSGLAVIALVFLALNPINARRHQIIRRRLNLLATRANRQVSLSFQPQKNQSTQPSTALRTVEVSNHVPNPG